MFPVVAEIVGVGEFRPGAGGDLFEGDLGIRSQPQLGIGNTELTVGGVERVHMRGMPVERYLQHLVQLAQRDVATNL